MNILVTGGGGFLGTEICKQLKKQGHQVTAVSRSRYPHLEELGVASYQADLSSGGVLELEGIDAVIHTAAKAGVWGGYEEYFKSNVLATENVLKACKKWGVKHFIYTSSPSVVFGRGDIENGDENLEYPKKFYTDYAKTKAMAEKMALEANGEALTTCAIRPHLIWGEGDPHIIPRLIMKARAGKLKIIGTGENLVDVIHVENAALAHIQALEAMVAGRDLGGKAYFIGQECPVNLWDFINKILFNAGLEGVEGKVGFKTAFALGFVFEKLYKAMGIKNPEPPMTRFVALQLAKSHYFSHQRARDDFDYEPRIGIEEGLATLFENKKAKLKKISELDA